MSRQPRRTSPPVSASLDDAQLSKTQLKKASHELQELGAALLELSPDKLAVLPMPESLRVALAELRRTRTHEGRRRQLQLVGKLMRHADPEPLREAVAAQRLPGARETLALHEAERWRDRLLADDEAFTVFIEQHPEIDAQALRSLVRQARREDQADAARGVAPRKGRSYREIFQVVRQALAGQNDANPPDDSIDHDERT